MKTYIILPFLAIALYFVGCKKDNQVIKPNPNVNGRIKTETTLRQDTIGLHFVDSVVYTYTPEGLLLDYIVKDTLGGPVAKVAYQYIDDLVKETRYQSDLVTITATTTFTLNTRGYVIHRTGQNYLYLYNADGYLINMENGLTGSIRQFTVSDGNLQKAVFTDADTTFTTLYSYYIDKPEYRNIGQPYFGTQSISTLSQYTTSVGLAVNYTYLYDAKGRVIKRTAVSNLTGTLITYYTYFD